MNNWQKQVQQYALEDEIKTIKQLHATYAQAIRDIDNRLEKLYKRFDPVTGDLPQSAVYQIEYQNMIKAQVKDVLDKLQSSEYMLISDYLNEAYLTGFIGDIYDLFGQDIPLVLPVRREDVIRAVTLDSKISHGLYTRLGQDVDQLKAKIASEMSRGVVQGRHWKKIAQQLARYSNIGYNNSVRITRTEGHRIQVSGNMDAMHRAKESGADIEKQWDATLDQRTRHSHRQVDGEIRDLDEPFSNGLMFPGDPSGPAKEVICCRCACLQRARWALGEAELERQKERAAYYDLDKSDRFEDFRKKYLKNVPAQPVKGPATAPDTIDACKTTKDVEDLFRSKGWFNVRKRYNANEKINLTGCDLESSKGVYRACDKIFTKYPQLTGKLDSVTTESLSYSTYAQCSVGLGRGGVELNRSYFKDNAKVRKHYETDVSHGFHPAGTTWEGIVIHEFGHAVDDYLTNHLHLAGYNTWTPKYVSAAMRPEVMRNCGLKVADAYTEVSGYATKDHFEWFAECFAEWVGSDHPRRVATEFGRILEEYLKNVD